MESEGKFVFLDAGGKFEEAKDAVYNAIGDEHDLTVYSLTPVGKTQPEHLIMKMTYAGQMDRYLLGVSRERAVAMLILPYGAIWPRRLHDFVKILKTQMKYADRQGKYLLLMRSNAALSTGQLSAQDFFAAEVDTESGKPEAEIYQMDKVFFLPEKKDPLHVKFSDLKMMHDGHHKVLTVDCSNADTGKITNMNRMFAYLRSVKQLDLSRVDTSSATTMECMFADCSSLKRLDLSGFDFTNVKNISLMLRDCTGLEEVVFPESVLQVPGVAHDTGRVEYETVWDSAWGGAHSPSQADFAGTMVSRTVSKPVVSKISFSEATDRERREHLGLKLNTKITIVEQRGTRR